jgi:hypothetical protein
MSEEERNNTRSKESVTPEPEHSAVPDAPDAESDLDGCDVEIEDVTPDEELPATEGGVI